MAYENNGFLERLRGADEDTKKLWVIAGTSVLTFIIVGVWLTWFNDLNMSAGALQTAESGTADISDHGFSFFETARSGGAALYQGALEGIRGIGGVLTGPKEYIIKPNN